MASAIARRLGACTLGQPFKSHHTIDSTNRAAMAWAKEGAPHGAVVHAEYQTEGKGRYGRVWQAAAGKNLLFSVVLRPGLAHSRLGLLTLVASLAVREALLPVVMPAPVLIKWPNDIMINGLKCCGILSQTAIGPSALVVIGIGLNVNQSVFPPNIADHATSVLLATGRTANRAALMSDILTLLENNLSMIGNRKSVLLARYDDSLLGKGQVRTVRFGHGKTITGRIAGITDSGALRMNTGNKETIIYQGELLEYVADD